MARKRVGRNIYYDADKKQYYVLMKKNQTSIFYW